MATINEQIRTQVYVVNSSITSDSSIPSQSKDRIAYSTIDKKLYRFDGSVWAELLEASSSIKLVDNFSSLPAEAKAGDCAITKDTNKQYYYDGSAWVLIDTAEKVTITPSETFGGLAADVTLSNMTAEEILKKMLEKELFSTVAANKPSASLSRSGNSEVELGTVIETLTLTASGDRGTYSPYYYRDASDPTKIIKGTSHDYAGAVESYTFSGSGISDTTQTANTFDISNYTVATSNSWSVKVLFADGEDIMSSQGNLGTPAKYTDASDTGKTATASITPTFPIYITSSNPSVLTRRASNVKTANSYIEVTLPIEDSPDGTNYNKLAFLVPASWLDGAYKVEVYNEGNGKWEDKTSNWTEYPATINWTDMSLTFAGTEEKPLASSTIASKTISGTAPKAGEYKLVVNSGGLVTAAPKVRFYR